MDNVCLLCGSPRRDDCRAGAAHYDRRAVNGRETGGTGERNARGLHARAGNLDDSWSEHLWTSELRLSPSVRGAL
jgi:hypothetical protein